MDVNETSASDVWEINFINSQSDEATDYSTQKPELLLQQEIIHRDIKPTNILLP